MIIAISGITGFIGSHLAVFLRQAGHKTIDLTRDILQNSIELQSAIERSDVVINLAGAPINRRWTEAYKKILYESRISSTRKIIHAINSGSRQPQLLISISAVGYYSNEGCHDEYSNGMGEGFLAWLCREWEEEANQVHFPVRLVIPRFGVVLAPDGGAFPLLAKSAKMKISAMIGDGSQPFAWIALTDLMRAMAFIIEQPQLDGVFNFVAPQQITNAELMNELSLHFNSWSSVKIPSGLFRLFYGEGAEFLTQGQCVIPTRLPEAGFRFQTPTVSDFLKQI